MLILYSLIFSLQNLSTFDFSLSSHVSDPGLVVGAPKDIKTELDWGIHPCLMNFLFTCLFVCLKSLQLKIYEDDFRRERSDKQVLQRLLLKKAAPNKDPVLIHRCNNEQQRLGEEKRAQSGEKRKQHHPLCPNHPKGDKESCRGSDKHKTMTSLLD